MNGARAVREREWIEDLLSDAGIVDWDRFIVEDHDGTQVVRIYGWIDPDDSRIPWGEGKGE